MFDFWIYQLYGGRVPLLTKLPSGGGNFSYYVSLENALRRLRARQGKLPSRAPCLLARSTPLGGYLFAM